MTEIIGVRFKDAGKVYYFTPNGNATKQGDRVIVETARGIECGEVAIENRMVEDEEVVSPLKPVIRMANRHDLQTLEQNKKKEEEAFAICQARIQKHHLEMKLVEVEYTFDGNKILFYFTADGRVDFRELVKDLASVFKTRIELRQIGVRDEAKCWAAWAFAEDRFAVTPFWVIFSRYPLKWRRIKPCRSTAPKFPAPADG